MSRTTASSHLTRRRLVGFGLLGAGAVALEAVPGASSALAAASGPRATSAAIGLPSARRIGPIAVPGGFDLAGLRWSGAAHASIELRARRRSGRWTQWLPVGHAHDHGPDAVAPASATDPVWTGRAEEVELRLSRPLRGLTLHTVRSDAPRTPLLTAHAAQSDGTPPIITRAQWGASAVKTKGTPQIGTVQAAFVHHTVNANGYTAADSASIVLAIAKYHVQSNGWNDIGYNFLVDKYGQIFEGRAGGIDKAIIGAQAQGFNSVSTGISNIGTFETVPQTDAALNAMGQLIAWKLALHGVPVAGTVDVVSAGGESNRFPSGRPVTLNRICGHRDGDKTTCPGSALYAQLPEIRRRAATHDYPVGDTTGQGGTPASTQLSISAAATQVAAYANVEVSGTLLDADGTAVSGAPVTVQKRGATRWSTAARATTDAQGRFATSVLVRQTTRLRAAYTGDAVVGGDELNSPEVSVSAVPALTIDLSAKRVAVGGRVSVKVAMRPTRSKLELVVSRRGSDGRYRTVSRQRLKVSGATGRISVRLSQPGLYGFTVVSPADSKGIAVTAPKIHVRCSRGATTGQPTHVDAGGIVEGDGGAGAVAALG
jgi:N-acetylmuramoyl-L-alanine amidase